VSWVVYVLLFVGVALLLLCAAGVLAMRSAADRLHYAAASCWGVLPIGVAILLQESWSIVGDKSLATAFVLLVCGPALGHATARAMRVRSHGAWNAPRGLRRRAGDQDDPRAAHDGDARGGPGGRAQGGGRPKDGRGGGGR
jgi:multisubunit Na+/H+ antiporter MnhG subunit